MSEKMIKITLTAAVSHDGKIYLAGEMVVMDEESAARLVKMKVAVAAETADGEAAASSNNQKTGKK